jgi:uncharacterized repeat protein (TIGR01451 family)
MNTHRSRNRSYIVAIGCAAAALLVTVFAGHLLQGARAAGSAQGAVLGLELAPARAALDPGTNAGFSIAVSNRSAVDATAVRLVVATPAGLSGMRWTCRAEGGARCPASNGSGAIDRVLDRVAAGGTLHFDVQGALSVDGPPWVAMRARLELSGAVRCAETGGPVCENTAMLPAGPRVDVALRMADATPSAGRALRYFLTVRNLGTVDAAGTVVRDPVPAGLDRFRWTCAGSAPCPQASGSGALLETLRHFPPGASLTFTIDATVAADPPPRITHTATANPPWGGSCGTGAAIHAPPCAASTFTPETAQCGTAGAPACPPPAAPDGTLGLLHVFVEADLEHANPGDVIDYQVTIRNDATDATATNIVVSDPVPAGISGFAWTCTGSGAECPALSGEGPINETVSGIQGGASIVYDIVAPVASDPPDFIDNLASADPQGDDGTTCAGGQTPPCTAELLLPTIPVIHVAKQAVSGLVAPGGTVEYTIDVGNSGTSAANVLVEDPIPAGLEGATWTCAAIPLSRAPTGSFVCPNTSGTGDIEETLPLLPSYTVSFGGFRYTVDATVASDAPGYILNTATVTPPAGAQCDDGSGPSCPGSAAVFTRPDVAISLMADTKQAVPGGTVTYTLTLDSAGLDAGGYEVIAPVPAGIDEVDWTCTPVGDVECQVTSGTGDIDIMLNKFPPFSRLEFTLVDQVSQSATGSITTTVTLTPPGTSNGICTPASCIQALTLPVAPVPMANLTITKTADLAALTPNEAVTYTITVTNIGDAAALDTVVSDPLPAGLSGFNWLCTSSTGECPNPGGSGDIAETIPILTGEVVYEATAMVAAQPPPTVTNVATITPAQGATCDGSVCTASLALPTQAAGSPELHVTKTTSDTVAVPGQTVSYGVLVANDGSADLGAVIVTDPIPPGLTAFSWTCSTDGASCPAASGTGAINETIPALPAGALAIYSITATVSATPPANITNVATAARGDGADCSDPALCTASVTLPAAAGPPNLVLSKTVFGSNASPGGTVHYTIVLANNGSGEADSVELTDPVPTGLGPFDWVCSGSACPNPSGSGPIDELIAALPAGTDVTYTLTTVVATDAPPSITNTATAVVPAGTPGCGGSNCTASATIDIIAPGTPNLVVTKTADVTSLMPGGTVVYTITIANQGDGDAGAVAVGDPLPAGIASFAWTCSGSDCPAASGSGGIAEIVPALPVGGSVVYTVDAVVSATPPAEIINQVDLSPSDATCTPSNCIASVTLPVSATPVPAVRVRKSATPPSGQMVDPGQSIDWQLSVTNSGAPTTAPVTLTDVLPTMIANVSVTAGSGVSCNTAHPAPGDSLVCQVQADFTGTRQVGIHATVAADASGQVRNGVTASGADEPVCSACTVANPVAATGTGNDVALGNVRAYSAAGIDGNLFDVVNRAGDVPVQVSLSPDSDVRLFAAYSAHCSADDGDDGSVVVTCPDPPPMQAVSCSGATCTIANLPEGATITLFAAPDGARALTAHAGVADDGVPDDNDLVLPAPGAP